MRINANPYDSLSLTPDTIFFLKITKKNIFVFERGGGGVNARKECPKCTVGLEFEDETQTFRCRECGWRDPMEEFVTRRVNRFDF